MKAAARRSNIIQDSGQNTGGAGVPAAGVSALAVDHSSHSQDGLKREAADMTRSVSMRPVLQNMPSESVVEFSEDGYRWLVSRCHADALRAAGVDWFKLRENRDAVLVKRNSHREVWRVACGNKAFFAKLYHPSDLAAKIKLMFRGPTAMREWEVGRYAAAHEIATVFPVAVALIGFRGAGGPSLLITEAVPGVMPLSDYWSGIRHDRHRANLLTESLAMLIARAHQCGFQHGDMHPGNILVRPVGHRGEALFVDLHKVRTAASVSLKQVIANLAQLNQWFRRHSTLSQRRRFLRAYLEYRDRYAQASPHARNYSFDPKALVAHLAVRAEKHANRLWSKRDRRTRRTGRYFARIRPAPGWRGHALLQSKHPPPLGRGARGHYAVQQWESWLAHPTDWVDSARHEVLKDSHTATVCKAMLPTDPTPAPVIVKRPLARNLLRRLRLMFGPSRNMRSWRMANMLLNRDLPVAQPLAVVERYALGFVRLDSVAFSDYIADSADLETFLTRDVASLPMARQRETKDRLLASVVRLLRDFHDRGFIHHDMKAPNLLVNWPPPYEGAPQLTFIDMDGIRHVRRSGEDQRMRALVRLCVSLLGSPACTRTDRLRFLNRHLTGPGRTSAQWKAMWHRINERVCHKQRDKEARRQWKLDRYGRE